MAVMLPSAQQPNDVRSSFDEFRKGLLENYKSFREDILGDYAKFLDGVWVEYKGFKGMERDNTPKPILPPTADGVPGQVDTPKPELDTPEPIADPPKPPKENPAPKEPGKFAFDFHGVTMEIPQMEIKLMERVSAPSDFAAQWRSFDSNADVKRLTNDIEALAKEHNFNDYLTYDLATAYTHARFAGSSPSARTSLVHYIMAHLGYDVRLGVNGAGQALLMFPSKQTIYGHLFIKLGNEKYYVFTDPAVTLSQSDMSFYTCDLPAAASQAAKLDLRLKPLKIPYEAKDYSVSFGGIEIKGETNAKLYPFLYKYPQMPIADYADSELLPDLRADVVRQLKEQLADKERDEAVDKLLQFVQSGFEYATDGEYHGFEKPYFFEEILYYPKCDCEDRVIFYTYLLWNVLGVENHLLAYPGHESAAVSLPGRTGGDAYTYDGRTFLISDPTFIGSKTGMCMPNYKTTTPEIDHIYK